MAAVLVAIFVIPTPSAGTYTTGVQMVSENPEVEVYGPALPSLQDRHSRGAPSDSRPPME